MPKTDPRIDAYIARARPFAQPILPETRARVHRALRGVEETIKWNAPFFLLHGKLLVSMAAFKAHVKVGIWEGTRPRMVDVESIEEFPPVRSSVEAVKAAAERIESMTKDKKPKTPARSRAKSSTAARSPRSARTTKTSEPRARTGATKGARRTAKPKAR